MEIIKNLESLSEERQLAKKRLYQDMEVQDVVIRLFDRIRERDPDIEKDNMFVEAYLNIKKCAIEIVENTEEDYKEICDIYNSEENKLDELNYQYNRNMDEKMLEGDE